MILELYGLPGSGKSYYIRQLNGNRPIGVRGSSTTKEYLIRAAKRISTQLPASFALKRRIYEAIRDIPNEPIFFPRKRAMYVDNLCMLAFGYRHAGKRNLYLDEGIIHKLVSFAVNYGFPVETVMELLELFRGSLEGVHVIYLNVPLDECLKSIRKRDRHECEMDELDDAQLRRFLGAYQNYFSAINERYGHETVNRSLLHE